MNSLNIVGCLFLITTALAQRPPVSLKSQHTNQAFQLSLSIADNQLLYLYSQKVIAYGDHVVEINTAGDKAHFIPPLNPDYILVNTVEEGRHLVEYYAKSESSDSLRHFHYAQIVVGDKTTDYLLPSFSHQMGALRIDKLYRCSNTLIMIVWCSGNAYLKIFSETQRWYLHEQIDDGFRSSEREIEFGEATDKDHSHPIQIDIGEEHHCIISPETPPAKISFDWKSKENYSLSEILNIVGDSLPVHRKQPKQDIDDDEL